MGGLKHLVLAKFKEGVVVKELLEGMDALVSKMDTVKSFEWGQDIESNEMLRQGFTHVFLLTFDCAEDYATYSNHPAHLEFATVFSTALEKVLLFDFPAVAVKSSA